VTIPPGIAVHVKGREEMQEAFKIAAFHAHEAAIMMLAAPPRSPFVDAACAGPAKSSPMTLLLPPGTYHVAVEFSDQPSNVGEPFGEMLRDELMDSHCLRTMSLDQQTGKRSVQFLLPSLELQAGSKTALPVHLLSVGLPLTEALKHYPPEETFKIDEDAGTTVLLAEGVRDTEIPSCLTGLKRGGIVIAPGRDAKLVFAQSQPDGSIKIIQKGTRPTTEMPYLPVPELPRLQTSSVAQGDINAEDGFGRTLLHEAAYRGDLETVKSLLQRGAQVDSGRGERPLHTAARMGGKEIVELLVGAGAKLDARDSRGNTPLHCAAGALSPNASAITELLISKGADVNAKSSSDETPLHRASWAGHAAVVKALIAAGADVNAKDISGQTPLSMADRFKRDAIVKILKEHGAR
jgi:ankyrin repeat protein